MKTYWTLTKTSLALVSIGILISPLLRDLGYLSPEPAGDGPDSLDDGGLGTRMVAPPELSGAANGDGEFSFPRH